MLCHPAAPAAGGEDAAGPRRWVRLRLGGGGGELSYAAARGERPLRVLRLAELARNPDVRLRRALAFELATPEVCLHFTAADDADWRGWAAALQPLAAGAHAAWTAEPSDSLPAQAGGVVLAMPQLVTDFTRRRAMVTRHVSPA